MRHVLIALTLVACGGGEPAKHEEPKKEAPTPPPAPPTPPPPPADPINKTVDISTMSPEEQHTFKMKLGEKVYTTGDGGIACSTCHGPEGKGTPPAFPPLVGQKDHMGDCAKHATFVIKGLSGPLKVDNVDYNGVMTPQGDLLNDLQIASVITFERNSWGNAFGDCSPDDVKNARAAAK